MDVGKIEQLADSKSEGKPFDAFDKTHLLIVLPDLERKLAAAQERIAALERFAQLVSEMAIRPEETDYDDWKSLAADWASAREAARRLLAGEEKPPNES